MRTIRIALVCSVLFVALAVTQAAAYDSVVVIVKIGAYTKVAYNMNMITMTGNYTWIPLNLRGTPEDNKGFILVALNEFEKQFPVKVLSFQVEKKQTADKGFTNDWTYGIWVHHEPKPERSCDR